MTPSFKPDKMKITLRYIVILLLAGISACAIPARIFTYRLSTRQVNENLFLIQTKSSDFYVYRDSGTVIAFDAGTKVKSLAERLNKFGIRPEDVTGVFLTHTDSDHSGNADKFINAKLYVPEGEEPLLKNKLHRGLFAYNPAITKAYQLVKAEEVIKTGGHTIKLIAVPGHTPGSSAYLLDEKYLFAGDAYETAFINRIVQKLIYHMNNKKAGESYDKIGEMAKKYIICTSHAGISYPK
jgi:hydroxyacylglutathione hydrolase